MEPQDDLLRAAARAVRPFLSNAEELRVSVEVSEKQVTCEVRGPAPNAVEEVPLPPLPKDAPENWAWLSPIGIRVVEVLRDKDWMSSESIATAINESATPVFKGRLQDMCDRGILESAPGRGYRLAKGEGDHE